MSIFRRILPSSSSSSASLFSSSRQIDDYIFEWCSKQRFITVRSISLRQEKEAPRHEFVLIELERAHYRVERRAVEGADLDSISKGCTARDTITLVPRENVKSLLAKTDSLIEVSFRSDRRPDLYTILAVCDAICKNPETNKYTLWQYNCYFFARTILLLVTRHYLLRHSPIPISARNSIGRLRETAINEMVAKVMEMDGSIIVISLHQFHPRSKVRHYYSDLEIYA